MVQWRFREGVTAKLLAEDYNAARKSGHRWAAWRVSPKHAWHIVGERWRGGKRIERIYLHRWIMQAGPEVRVYHRNGRTLDNWRKNLVVVPLKPKMVRRPQGSKLTAIERKLLAAIMTFEVGKSVDVWAVRALVLPKGNAERVLRLLENLKRKLRLTPDEVQVATRLGCVLWRPNAHVHDRTADATVDQCTVEVRPAEGLQVVGVQPMDQDG